MNEWTTAASHFHFLRPAWLLGLPVLLLAAFVAGRIARPSAWRRVVDPELLDALLERGGAARQDLGRRALLWLLAALGLLALAGPAWRELPQPMLARKAGLVVVLDLSDGMRAGDVAPSRDARARYKIADLIRARADGQTGLVAYAGDAFTVAPMTEDGATLGQLLDALDPDVMPVRGQRLDRGLARAADLLHDAGFSQGRILVLSAAASERDPAAAAAAQARGYRVDVIGIGSAAGAPVPVPGGGFQRDADGEIVLARLDADRLRAVAGAGGGQYQPLSADAGDLRALGLLDADAGGESRSTDNQALRYADEGPWLLLLALPLAALLFRRGLFFLLPWAVLGALPRPAAAFDWKDLWQRPDQQAWQALQEGRNEAARAAAADPAVSGAAAYRDEDYVAAAERFAQRDDADAHYNRGNALARAGRLDEALAAYDAALERAPGDEDAAANRAAVEAALKQQDAQSAQSSAKQKPQGGQGQSGQSSTDPKSAAPPEGQPPEGEGAQPKDDQGGEDAQQAEGEDGQPSQADADTDAQQAADADPAQSEASAEERQAAAEQAHREAVDQALQAQQAGAPADAQSAPPATALQPIDPAEAEKQQAAEQWLRRIPDDPGGLLRRKFALEHRRRVLEGEDE